MSVPYGAAFAEVYDRWYPHDDEVDAAAAGLAALAAGGCALELGVGTGRLALPLAALGVQVWGVDSSPEMLAVLSAKDRCGTVTAVAGDMAVIPMPARAPRFDLVFAAFNTFFLLTVDGEQQRCLRRCRTVVRPGGRLALELYSPARSAPGHHSWSERVTVAGGQTVPHRYRRTGDGLFVGSTGGRPWALRPAALETVDAMAAEAGFVLESRWGSWRGDPFYAARSRHVSVYRAVSTP